MQHHRGRPHVLQDSTRSRTSRRPSGHARTTIWGKSYRCHVSGQTGARGRLSWRNDGSKGARMAGGRRLWSGSHADADSRACRTVTDCDRAARKKGDYRVETAGKKRARQGETPCRAWGVGPGCGSGQEMPPSRGPPVQRAVRRMLKIGHTPTRTRTIGRQPSGDLVGTAGLPSLRSGGLRSLPTVALSGSNRRVPSPYTAL